MYSTCQSLSILTGAKGCADWWHGMGTTSPSLMILFPSFVFHSGQFSTGTNKIQNYYKIVEFHTKKCLVIPRIDYLFISWEIKRSRFLTWKYLGKSWKISRYFNILKFSKNLKGEISHLKQRSQNIALVEISWWVCR